MAKKTNRPRWQDPTYLFFVVLVVVIIGSSVIAMVATPSTQTTVDTDVEQVLNTPVPTPFIVPTPEPDGPNLNMTIAPGIQANGLFQVTVPIGWFTSRSEFDPDLQRSRTSFSDPNRLSVIDVMLQYGVNYPSLQALSEEFFTDNFFVDAWRDYNGFSETERTVTDRVVVDFDLIARQVDYIGRQVAWLDGSWLHMIRYIVPANNPALLEELDRLVSPTFISYRDQADLPPAWTYYADTSQGFLFRHSGWTQVSGDIGSPTVFEDPLTSARLYLQRSTGVTLADLTAAQAYLTDVLRPTATVLSSQVTARQFGAGFILSYTDADNDGNELAGVVLLLADASDLKVADLRLPASGVDLLSLEQGSSYERLRQIMDSFMILPPTGYTANFGGSNIPTSTIVEPTQLPEATAEATAE